MRARLLSALCVGAIALPASAQDSRWWCATEGSERVSYTQDAIFLNEHTVCTSQQPIQLTSETEDAWSGAVTCTNIYVTGQAADGTAVTTSVPVDGPDWLALVGAADGTLYLFTAPDAPRRSYLPC